MPLLSLAHGQTIVTYSVLFVAFLVSITLAGASQAACAKVFGDDTPEEAGYLSLNPLDHIHLIGFLMFLLLGAGFGPIQPIHTAHIWPNWKDLKLFLIYMTKPAANLILAIISLVSMLALFGGAAGNGIFKITMLITYIFQERWIPIDQFFSAYPDAASYTIVGGLLLLAMIFANIVITPLNAVVNGTHYLLALALERQSQYIEYAHYFALFGPFIVIFFYYESLRYICLAAALYGAQYVAALLGIG